MANVSSIGIAPKNSARLASYYARDGVGFHIDARFFHHAVERLQVDELGEPVVVMRDEFPDLGSAAAALKELVEATRIPRLPDFSYEGGLFPPIGGPAPRSSQDVCRVEIVDNAHFPGFLVGVHYIGRRWVICGAVETLSEAMDLAISRSEAMGGIRVWDFSGVAEAPSGGDAA